MRKILFFLLIIPYVVWSQADKNNSGRTRAQSHKKLIEVISEDAMVARLHFLCADFFEGRRAGSKNELAAALYLAAHYKSLGVPPIARKPNYSLESYLQPFEFNTRREAGKSQNVLAFFEGSDPVLKNDVIVLIAHYDHLGIGPKVGTDSIYNSPSDHFHKQNCVECLACLGYLPIYPGCEANSVLLRWRVVIFIKFSQRSFSRFVARI